DEAFPRSWLNCTVPVFFDFENVIALPQEAMYVTRPLWCLLPGRVFGRAVVLKVSREAFVRWIHDRAHPIPTRALLKSVERSFIAARAPKARAGKPTCRRDGGAAAS